MVRGSKIYGPHEYFCPGTRPGTPVTGVTRQSFYILNILGRANALVKAIVQCTTTEVENVPWTESPKECSGTQERKRHININDFIWCIAWVRRGSTDRVASGQIQRIAKGAGGKGPRQKTSKIVKNRQKAFRQFSTVFAQGKKLQKSSKSVKKFFDTFRQFSRGTILPAPFGGL